MKTPQNKLYLVSTPIGNYDDITLRALKVLQEVDFIICEEYKEGSKLLNFLQIKKPLTSLNEHNEKELASEVALEIINGKSAALISDCGTPVFSDPGLFLVDFCISANINIVPVPGASSLMPALIGSGFDINKFYFYGWLSPKKDIRRMELKRVKGIKELIVLLDTPYRLISLLKDCADIMGANKPAVVAYQLTLPNEKYMRGGLEDLYNKALADKLKGEFVLLINNR
ncbi:MAG: 16S rRNA (cytidine(1402)-2'-O)-methyltransferase [bacterium]